MSLICIYFQNKSVFSSSGLVIDLRGYVPLDIHKRIKALGVTSSDISSMFNAAKRPLQVLTKLIDRQDITRTAGEGRD